MGESLNITIVPNEPNWSAVGFFFKIVSIIMILFILIPDDDLLKKALLSFWGFWVFFIIVFLLAWGLILFDLISYIISKIKK